MTQFNWLEWAVVLLGICVFILGSFLMQVLNETQRQKQSVDAHAQQIKRLTSLLRDLDAKNKDLHAQTTNHAEEAEEAEQAEEQDIQDKPVTVDDLLDNKTI